MHMPPPIMHHSDFHLGNAVAGKMVTGMVFTIEPILMMHANYQLALWSDGWTVVDTTLGPAAQFEHTVLITKNGCEVLTKRD